MRIVIDTRDHPQPARLMLQLEALLSVHDPEPCLTVLADHETA